MSGTPASLPAGWSLVDGYLIGPGANLDGAGLGGADLHNANLSGANLERADLSSTDLVGAGLQTADITGANFSGSNLTDANLANAQVTQVTSFSGLVFSCAPPVCTVVYTYGYEPGYTMPVLTYVVATFTSGPDFTGAVLKGANLDGANLGGSTSPGQVVPGFVGTFTFVAVNTPATFTDVSSGGTTGTPTSLPSGWTLKNGFLIGPGANLSDDNLSGENFAGVDFSGVNLSGANFTGTNFTGAIFVGANLAGVIWSNTTCPDGSNSDTFVAGCFGTPIKSPTVSCRALSGSVNGTISLRNCDPLSKTNRAARAPGSFLASGGVLTWSGSRQTTIVTSKETSAGRGGCRKHSTEHDLTGVVTGGDSLYTQIPDRAALRACETRFGAVSLVPGTTATF